MSSKTFMALFCILLFSHEVMAEKECTNFDIDGLIANGPESVEAVERLQMLKESASHFFSYKNNDPSIPAIITLETAVDMVYYLRIVGLQEVDIQVTEEGSRWWRYPMLSGIGIVNFIAGGAAVVEFFPPPRVIGARIRLPIPMFWALLAGVGIPLILGMATDIGEKPFFCRVLWDWNRTTK